MRIYLTTDPSQVTDKPRLVGTAKTGREARRMAALRGLAQAPTERGTCYYAPGANDYDGSSVEIEY